MPQKREENGRASQVERAQALVSEGKPDEARSVLLEAASGHAGSSEARRLYEQLFPLTPLQKEWITGTLSQLTSEDAASRAKAAKDLCRKAAAESTVQQRDLIGDPRALDHIIPAVRSSDPKVAECATIAVSQAALFYNRDWRAWEPVLDQLNSKKPVTRRWAVEAAGYLGRERALDAILPLLDDGVEDVRDQVSRSLVWMLRSGVLPTQSRERLVQEFLPRLASKKTAERTLAANVLRLANDGKAIEPLQKALKRETGKEPKKWIEYAIRCLEAGNPELPL